MKQSFSCIPLIAFVLLLFACHYNAQQKANFIKNSPADSNAIATANKQVNNMLDSFHLAAAQANFTTYFNYFAPDAIFIGTDASERWSKAAFMQYARPHFDKGKAWTFTALERHIYFDATINTAWFDELLNTRMQICRGSGVLVKTGHGWQLKQYVLSMTIPNSAADSVIKIKSLTEEKLIDSLKQK